MKTTYTFHSHTHRCGHAKGDIEDYLKLGLKNNITIYGVSDHVFLPGVVQKGTRGDYSLLDEYIGVYKDAKAKYENKIEMYLGFECEYGDCVADYYKSLLLDKGFDFLICGQHCHFDVNKQPHFYSDTLEGIELYKNDIIDAMKSGLFFYIAHPDLFFIFFREVTDLAKRITKEIIDAAIKYDAVLEINRHGFLRKRDRFNTSIIEYPCDYFWSEVAKTNLKVVVGGDFHDPAEIEDKDLEDKLDSLVEKYNLKLTDIKDVYKDYRERIKKTLWE